MIKKQITEIKERGRLTERIIACSYKVHSELGPGFGENIYHNALKIALKQQGLRYQTQESFAVLYQSKDVGRFKLDLIIEDKVVVEVKALTGNIPTVFESQVLSYLKASRYKYKIGLLINFGNRSLSSEAINDLITAIFLKILVIRYNPLIIPEDYTRSI